MSHMPTSIFISLSHSHPYDQYSSVIYLCHRRSAKLVSPEGDIDVNKIVTFIHLEFLKDCPGANLGFLCRVENYKMSWT